MPGDNSKGIDLEQLHKDVEGIVRSLLRRRWSWALRDADDLVQDVFGEIRKHPDADSLEITEVGGVGGYPCITRTGEFKRGDKAVYVPIGAILPAEDTRWDFLRTKMVSDPKDPSAPPVARFTPGPVLLEAKKLRGRFSMGLLAPADPAWDVGQDVQQILGIVRAEPAEPKEGEERDPGLMRTYTDIAALRAFPDLLQEGEEVVITEKIHGENARYAFSNGRLYCGSRTGWKDPNWTGNGRHFWDVGRRLDLASKLATVGDFGFYGEVYGDVKMMKYGSTSDRRGFLAFDAMAFKSESYLDYDDFAALASKAGLPVAPVLYRGPWRQDLRILAEGSSTLAKHVKEGIVIRPVKERFHESVGRVILKLHGEDFLLKRWNVG